MDHQSRVTKNSFITLIASFVGKKVKNCSLKSCEHLFFALSGFAAICSPITVSAVPVSYGYTVNVTGVSGTLAGTGLNIGSQISGEFTVDSSYWIQHDSSADWIGYGLVQAKIDLGGGAQSILYPDAYGLNVLGIYQGKTGSNFSLFGIDTYNAANGQSLGVSLNLQGSSVFSDVSILGPLTVAGFSGQNSFLVNDIFAVNGLGNVTGTLSGTVTNIDLVAAVPEPETYAMMLAGLGLMGFVARRRKQKEAA